METENENTRTEPTNYSTMVNIRDAIAHLEGLKQSMKDYVVPSERVKAEYFVDEMLRSRWGIRVQPSEKDDISTDILGLTPFAFQQLATRLGVPVRYARRMEETGNLDLLVRNLNTWMDDSPKRMLRTFAPLGATKPLVRAVLSDRYRCIDNLDTFVTAVDAGTSASKGVKFHRCSVTDTRLYVVMHDRGQMFELDDSDYWPGVVLTNSEVGDGALSVQPMLVRGICSNGVIMARRMKQVHLGEKVGDGVYTPETMKADAKAVLLKVRDLVTSTFTDRKVFEEAVRAMQEAKGVVLEFPSEVIENMGRDIGLLDDERSAIINRLISDETIPDKYRSTAFGVVQAVTAFANTIENPDRSLALQEMGATVLEMPKAKIATYDYKQTKQ